MNNLQPRWENSNKEKDFFTNTLCEITVQITQNTPSWFRSNSSLV